MYNSIITNQTANNCPVSCNIGYYCPTKSPVAIICPLGYYQNTYNSVACKLCEIGYVCNQ